MSWNVQEASSLQNELLVTKHKGGKQNQCLLPTLLGVIQLESFVIRLESFPIFLHFDIIG